MGNWVRDNAPVFIAIGSLLAATAAITSVLVLIANARFNSIDTRLDGIIKSFDAVDTRFADLLQHIDTRFAASDKRFAELLRHIDTRFAASDKRFDDLLDQHAGRYEAVDTRFTDLLRHMDTRFDAVDTRFTDVQRQMHSGFSAADQRASQVANAVVAIGNSLDSFGQRISQNERDLSEAKREIELIQSGMP
ncbi:MAG: hypothetical protein OXP66_03760 [Candidatus Tectomicrobia bacterium]|nr:hypothetical protein [Candidatus Tectomicrobia bacterium]